MVMFIKTFFLNRKQVLSQALQLRFLQQLNRLLANGYPLIDALDILAWDKALKNAAHSMIANLQKGLSIDQVFERGRFHHTIVAHLYFSRKSGDVQRNIQKNAELFEKRMAHTKKLQQTVRYPLILCIIFFLLLFMLKRSVLPSFTAMQTTSSLPLQLSLAFLNHLEMFVLIICVVCVLFFLIWQKGFKRLNVQTQIKVYTCIPFYRKILSLQTSFQFATHLSALLKTDLSFNTIFKNMSEQKRLPIIGHYTSLMVDELNKGKYVSSLLAELTLLEKQFAVIFQKTKDRGALENDLTVYADFLIDTLQRKVMKIIAVIQPIFFALLAILIVLVYLSLMLPMYELIKTI